MGKAVTKRRYIGWRPDVPDARDYKLTFAVPAKLPVTVDLRRKYGTVPIYDQGLLGSCTANAIAAAIEYERLRQKFKLTYPSRLFIYWNARQQEGTVSVDAGAYLRTGIKVVNRYGVCPEDRRAGLPNNAIWPYNTSKFRTKPPNTCYKAAVRDRVVLYQRVGQTLNQMKTCLSSGYPFVIGVAVYESFDTPAVERTGVVPMPTQGESMLGGHTLLVVGYNDASQRFLVRNSWGSGWGMGGYCTIPYAYLIDNWLADDLWNIQLVTD